MEISQLQRSCWFIHVSLDCEQACTSSRILFEQFSSCYQVGDLSIHESVATFTALLIARSCFSLEDVIYHVALPSLLVALPSGELQHTLSVAFLLATIFVISFTIWEPQMGYRFSCTLTTSGNSENGRQNWVNEKNNHLKQWRNISIMQQIQNNARMGKNGKDKNSMRYRFLESC